MSWGGYIPGDLLRATQDPREARLPKWAQSELSTLRRKVRDAERHIRDLQGDVTATDTHVDGMRGPENRDIPLPPGSRVAYRLTGDPGHGAFVRAWLQADAWTGVALHIQGDRTLVILPSASNTFRVAMRD